MAGEWRCACVRWRPSSDVSRETWGLFVVVRVIELEDMV